MLMPNRRQIRTGTITALVQSIFECPKGLIQSSCEYQRPSSLSSHSVSPFLNSSSSQFDVSVDLPVLHVLQRTPRHAHRKVPRTRHPRTHRPHRPCPDTVSTHPLNSPLHPSHTHLSPHKRRLCAFLKLWMREQSEELKTDREFVQKYERFVSSVQNPRVVLLLSSSMRKLRVYLSPTLLLTLHTAATTLQIPPPPKHSFTPLKI